MFLPLLNYRHLQGRGYWCRTFTDRSNTAWTLRVAQECMLGLPVSYNKDLKLEITYQIPEEYKDTFKLTLERNNHFANTVIWC